MSVAIRTAVRIQDQDDAPTLGAGQDGYALTWDNASGAFVATALVTGGLLATGATVGATAQAQAFTNGLTAGGTYDGTISAVRGLQLVNPTDQYFYNYLRSGATVDQKVYFAWADYAGVTKWYFGKDQVNNIVLFDTLSAVHRLTVGINDATIIDSAGANAVIVNGCGNANSGTGGLIVKSGTTERATYGSITNVGLTINGVVEMQATTSAITGVITKGNNRFIHNFKHPIGGTALPVGENSWFGLYAGNFTTGETASQTYHSSYNTGVGQYALTAVTTGYYNTSVGARSLLSNTTGFRNCAFGTFALRQNTSGDRNMAIGFSALDANTEGYYNVAIGDSALVANTTGDKNVVIGMDAGHSQTTANLNVMIGYNAGYYETGSSKLFIDNASRASEADGRAKALIYGVFDAAVANQEITFNVGKHGFFGTPAVAKPTGVAVSAEGIHAALVTLGLIAA